MAELEMSYSWVRGPQVSGGSHLQLLLSILRHHSDADGCVAGFPHQFSAGLATPVFRDLFPVSLLVPPREELVSVCHVFVVLHVGLLGLNVAVTLASLPRGSEDVSVPSRAQQHRAWGDGSAAHSPGGCALPQSCSDAADDAKGLRDVICKLSRCPLAEV